MSNVIKKLFGKKLPAKHQIFSTKPVANSTRNIIKLDQRKRAPGFKIERKKRKRKKTSQYYRVCFFPKKSSRYKKRNAKS